MRRIFVSVNIKIGIKLQNRTVNAIWMTIYWIIGNTYTQRMQMMRKFKFKFIFGIAGILLAR